MATPDIAPCHSVPAQRPGGEGDPQASGARQLRVVTRAHALPEVVSPRFVIDDVLHVSEVVGAVKDGDAGHCTVPFGPCPATGGGGGPTSIWSAPTTGRHQGTCTS